MNDKVATAAPAGDPRDDQLKAAAALMTIFHGVGVGGAGGAAAGHLVAYGSPAIARRSWLSKLGSALKTPFMLALHVVFPLSIIVSWLLFPLWFEPLHQIAWGPIEIDTMARIAALLHALALFLPAILIVATLVVRLSGSMNGTTDGHWWWDPPKKD